MQSSPLTFRSDYQVFLYCIGDFFIHTREVNFIYFCIVLHFIFIGEILWTLLLIVHPVEIVWLTVLMKKTQSLLLLPV